MAFRYTETQKNAIKHRDGNLLILACAGSGKTEVISRRIAKLVEEGIPKNAIIAFTFTERAADALKARIRLHLEDLQPHDPSLGDMYVGTIHSFCLQLLKEIDPTYRKYEVMDEARQAAMIMTNFHHFPDTNTGIGLEHLRTRTRTGGYWHTVRTFTTSLNVMYQKGITPEEISDKELRSAIIRYQQIAYDYPNYFFDFDQIISEVIEKLKKDKQELNRIRSQFKYLVIDEYQDVDDRQEELIRIISDTGKKVWVTAVGDDDQAIYGWRGARIDNILNFKSIYPNVQEYRLIYNFRSTHAIVEIANHAIRNLPADQRLEKEMEARHWDMTNSSPALEETLSEYGDAQIRASGDEQDEAEWVADRIHQLRGTFYEGLDGSRRGLDYADMAILLRSVRSSGRIFTQKLQENGIPVVVKGTGGLFDHDEVLLVQAIFSLLTRSEMLIEDIQGYHRLDELAIREFIREKIQALRNRDAMPLANPAKSLEWIAAKREELDRQNLEKERRGHLARRIYPQTIFQEILHELGSAKGPDPWPPDVMYNLGRLSNLITQFEAVHQWVTPNDLGSLCMFLGGWAAGRVDEGGLEEIGTPNAVQIMTIHAAKGLEWPVVFVSRISSANFPSSLRNRGPETFLDESIFNPKEYAGGDQGERRLWYVALTRCQKYLNLTSVNRRRKRPTIFLNEIKHERVQKEGEILNRKKGKPAPPARVDLLPTTYTDLSYFWRCPFEYQLRSLMRYSPGVSETYGYGQQIHNILAEIHKRAKSGEILTIDEVIDLVDERFHLRYTRDGEKYKPLTGLRDAAKKSLQRYLEQYPDNIHFVLEAEKPFEFIDRRSNVLISGTVDLLQRIDESQEGDVQLTPVAIIDFKTHGWESMEKYQRIKEQVEIQLRLYALAVRDTLGFNVKKARAHILSPKGPTEDLERKGAREVIIVDASIEQQQSTREKVHHAIKGIKQSIQEQRFEFGGCEKGFCRKCDYRKICPGLALWDKRDQTSPRPLSAEEEREEEMKLIMDE